MAKRAEMTVDDVLEVIGWPTRLGRRARKLPPDVIRGVLAAKCDEDDHLFLRLAVDDDGDDKKLVRSWERAVQGCCDCYPPGSWGSKPRRDRIRALAKQPRILQAIQGTVAHLEEPRDDMLAVLVADGSRESLDALVRHLDPALTERDERLDLLKKLRTHAKRTPVLDELFAEIDAALDDRGAKSGALALGPLIGLGRVDPFWLDAKIGSRLPSGHPTAIQADIHVDSRKAEWLTVAITDPSYDDWKTTRFNSKKLLEDALKLGRCDATELPTWLSKVAGKFGITWNEPAIFSSVRGAKRDLVVKWLCGGVVPKSPAFAIAEAIGLGTLADDRIWFTATFDSKQRLGKIPRAVATVKLDSSGTHVFTAYAGAFDDNGEWQAIHLGDIDELRSAKFKVAPWISGAAKQFGVTWKPARIESGLRGAKRDRVAAWLAGK